MAKRHITLDYETQPIDARPDYPPRPVGASLKIGAQRPRYHAWGHPSGNNTTLGDFKRVLRSELERPDTVLVAHNQKFEHDVTETHLGLRMPPPERCEDSMLLAFLDDPYNPNLQLKPLAVRELDEPPEERDVLRDWILENIPAAKGKKSQWARHICETPGDIVAPYANGDAERSAALVAKLRPTIDEDGMTEAYLRELRLIPILLRSERDGIPIDMPRLAFDVKIYNAALVKVDAWIAKRVRRPGLVIDERDELAEAIEKAGKAKGGWLLTPTGRNSTSADSLEHALSDKLLRAALAYRGSLATCLRTFMGPWLEMALRTKGSIHTQWHSTRDAGEYGARTGRLSSTPNLQNIPTEFEDEEALFKATRLLTIIGLPSLPLVRSYIVAGGAGSVLIGRDYNSQELRVLAHYEDGDLAEQYCKNPRLDVHQYVAGLIRDQFPDVPLGANPRRTAKTLNFLKVYGGGVPKLAVKLGIDLEASKQIMDAYLSVFPGLKDLNKDMRRCERDDEPIRTLGGRLYYVEPPRIIKGRLRSFAYKMLNYLVQGSSADMTKEAVIRYDAARQDSRLLLTVHDEVLLRAEHPTAAREMRKLKEAMESVALDVPLLTDGEIGERWTEMKECA